MTVDERKLVTEEISTKARNLFLQEATIPNSPICNIVAKRKADGGRIAFANGSNCAIEVAEAFDKNPKGFAQEVNKLPEESGAFNKVKSAASKFLNVAKKGGRFAAFAGVGAAAGAVKQFMSDDPTSYLSDENQQKNMLIDMVTEPVMEERDPGITSSAQFPLRS
jgi:arginyl-tRNA synthetase